MKPKRERPGHAAGWCRCRDWMCPCCQLSHTQCLSARPCLGGCGRQTTAHASCAPGYCPACAADPRWVPLDGAANTNQRLRP